MIFVIYLSRYWINRSPPCCVCSDVYALMWYVCSSEVVVPDEEADCVCTDNIHLSGLDTILIISLYKVIAVAHGWLIHILCYYHDTHSTSDDSIDVRNLCFFIDEQSRWYELSDLAIHKHTHPHNQRYSGVMFSYVQCHQMLIILCTLLL